MASYGGALGAILVIGVLVVLDRMALSAIRPRKKVHARTVRDLPFQAREHSFSSLDQRLAGWFLVPENDVGRAVVVLVHGWGSSHGRMTLLAEPLLRAGYPVFLFDVRHHGESPEASFVTARHFRDDIRAAAREVKSAYPNRPLVLVGHSMGGSAAILAVAESAPVDGLVTIAAPADLWEVWAHHFQQRGLPGRWTVRVLSPFWRLRAGVSFHTLRPEKRVAEVGVPLLILHGDADRSVSVSHARTLGQVSGIDPVILQGEGHNEILGSEALVSRVLGFTEKVGG